MRSERGRFNLMVVAMVGVTIWSCVDGGRGWPVILAASVGTVSAMMVLGIIASYLPATRLITALFSGLWILLFMPAWDWLEGRFTLPDSIYTALLFGAGFAILRYVISGGGSARPPS